MINQSNRRSSARIRNRVAGIFLGVGTVLGATGTAIAVDANADVVACREPNGLNAMDRATCASATNRKHAGIELGAWGMGAPVALLFVANGIDTFPKTQEARSL